MKRKKGYTIAEALITMAIIGLVATLTIPTLVMNYRKQIYAKTLAVAVADFQNAMKALMFKEGVDSLLNTTAWQAIKKEYTSSGGSIWYDLRLETDSTKINNFNANLNKVFPLEKISYSKSDYRYMNKSEIGDLYQLDKSVGFITPHGIIYYIYILFSINYAPSTGLLYGYRYNEAATVTIDINGKNGPNLIGRDLFFYDLDDQGRLVPSGSADWLSELSTQNKTSQASDCKNRQGAEDNYYNQYCSAYLMENGYKMDY